MIRVLREDPTGVHADAFLRSIGADMEPCTAVEGLLGDAAGTAVLDRLRSFGDFPVGGAVVTPAGGLDAAFLIHVVIRSLEEPISAERIRKAFRNGLRQAAEWDIETLAVPPLGIGAGNLDPELSARVMCRVVAEHAREADHPSEVLILVSGAYDEEAFSREAARVFGGEPPGEASAADPLPTMDPLP